MPKRSSSRKPRRSSARRSLALLVVGVALLFILFNSRGLVHLSRLRAEQRHLEVEIALLSERASELRQEMVSLESDLVYIERLAREKYRMVKRGEKVFRVIRNQRAPENAQLEPHQP